MIHWRKVGSFVVLAYALSYALLFGYLALGGRWEAPGATVVTIAYMFMPLVAAVVCQRGLFGEDLVGPLRISFDPNRWFALAWVLPPLLALGTLGAGLLVPGVSWSGDLSGMLERLQGVVPPDDIEEVRTQIEAMPLHPLVLGLVAGMVAGATVNAVAAFGEELGWRGLLLRELEPLGFWKGSALIGVFWGFWHAPIILLGHNYPDHPLAGVFMMTLFTVLLSPLLTLVTVRSGSTIAAAVFHGTLNGTGGLSLMLLRGGSDLTVGITGAAGALVLVVTNLSLWIWLRRTERSGAARAA